MALNGSNLFFVNFRLVNYYQNEGPWKRCMDTRLLTSHCILKRREHQTVTGFIRHLNKMSRIKAISR